MVEFVFDFLGGIAEMLLEPWIKKIAARLRRRKRK